MVGQCVGALIHLAVVQAMLAHLSRYTFWRAGGPGFDHGMHGLLVINLRQRRRVERFQQVTAFLFADQRDAIKMRLLISRQGFEDLHEIVEIPLRRGFVEQRRGVVQRPCQRLALLAQVQRKVEFGHLTVLLDRLHSQVAKRIGNVFSRHPVQRGLEQRRMGQAACRANDFHNLFERQVLMLLCFQYAGLDPGQQRLAARIARGVDAHRQGVDEQADQVFKFGMTSPCHRAANHHVGLTRKARECRRPGGHQRHVQRDALTLCQFAQVCCQICIQLHGKAGTGEVLLRRTWPISRQREQRRRSLQCLMPIGGLVLQAFAGQPATLPYRVIGVLDRQRRQWIGLSLAERRVQLQQFLAQYSHRPTIGDDMVHSHQQHMTVVGHLQQMSANQRAVSQIERCYRLDPNKLFQAMRRMTNVFDRQPGVCAGGHEQYLRSAFTGHKSAAQGFMAFDDTCQGSG
ncbi:Uncharacterized protein AC517_3796 [Pseudomonas syringae pv. syringae]|nr:Uncharacterized protein AC517_3796 [Pseudomonas syringae pv. syringae]